MRAPGRRQERERRGREVERPPRECQPHRPVGPQGDRQVQGLEHEGGRAGGADVDPEIAGRVRRGAEGQVARADRPADHRDTGPAQLGGAGDGRHVLRPQPGLVAIGPDLDDPKRAACQQRQRQGRAEDLAAPFSLRTVERDQARRRRGCRSRFRSGFGHGFELSPGMAAGAGTVRCGDQIVRGVRDPARLTGPLLVATAPACRQSSPVHWLVAPCCVGAGHPVKLVLDRRVALRARAPGIASRSFAG